MSMTIARGFAVTLLGLLFLSNLVRGDPDVTTVNILCNPNQYASNDPYANSVAYILNDMATVTANHPGYNYYTNSPYSQATAYGHAVCNSALSFTDCASCMSYAKSCVVDECGTSIGVQLQLQDCRMRYENYQFSE